MVCVINNYIKYFYITTYTEILKYRYYKIKKNRKSKYRSNYRNNFFIFRDIYISMKQFSEVQFSS